MWRYRPGILRRMSAARLLVCSLVGCSLPGGANIASGQQDNALAAHASTAAKTYADYDVGLLPAQTVLRPLHIALAQPLAKKNALIALSIAQQDSQSNDFHHWISPEEFGQRFGADPKDIRAVTDWLQNAGMKNVEVARGGNIVSFTATVQQLQAALQIRMHLYRVQGEGHYANTTAPVLPAPIRGIVSSVQGLNDFGLHLQRNRWRKASAEVTGRAGVSPGLGPGDLAILYDVKPLYEEAAGGAQPTIAVVGAADASLDDFRQYKNMFALPANDFHLVRVPGSVAASTEEAELETALDLEIAGGIAPLARLVYVEDGDVFGGAEYVIDHRLADVLSLSYTVCELPGPEDFAYEVLAQQGTVEGITWINASGDSGAAGCDGARSASAFAGLAVNLPASLPEVTGVGGTRFTDLTTAYWTGTAAADGTTALSYVPETGWNGSQDNQPVTASGGGVSKDFFKPGYQSSIQDSVVSREVPDVALDAADASPSYLIVTGGSVESVGGTSAATPLFAGITALLSQYVAKTENSSSTGLGNINPVLYRLAQVAPDVFHDVATGTNIVGCTPGSVDCIDNRLGYESGVGYDRVTGLGSVDAEKLAHAWTSADIASSSIELHATAPAVNGAITLTAEVQAGADPLQGVVVFSWTNLSYSSLPAEFARVTSNVDGIARTSLSSLPEGINTVSAVFQGTTAQLGAVSAPLHLRVAGSGKPLASIALIDVQPAYPEGKYLPLAAAVTGNLTLPTGSVDFFLGNKLLATAPVADGVATALAAILPPVGTSELTARYRGDTNYAAVVSTGAPVSILAAATAPNSPEPDFALTIPSTLTLPQGENGSFAIAIVPLNGFASAVTLTCSGTVSGYDCSVPTSVLPSTSVNVQGRFQKLSLAFLSLGPLTFIGLLTRRRRCVLYSMASVGILLQTSCGLTINKSASGDSAVVYPVTITATSGSIQHSAMLSVTVQ
jgi:hypothetical protein